MCGGQNSPHFFQRMRGRWGRESTVIHKRLLPLVFKDERKVEEEREVGAGETAVLLCPRTRRRGRKGSRAPSPTLSGSSKKKPSP